MNRDNEKEMKSECNSTRRQEKNLQINNATNRRKYSNANANENEIENASMCVWERENKIGETRWQKNKRSYEIQPL